MAAARGRSPPSFTVDGRAGCRQAKPRHRHVRRPAEPAAAVTGGLLLGVSLAILPTWPLDWMHVMRAGVENHYRAPVVGGRGLLALGPALLVVLLRWRRPEARLLAAPARLLAAGANLLRSVPRARRRRPHSPRISPSQALLSGSAVRYLRNAPPHWYTDQHYCQRAAWTALPPVGGSHSQATTNIQ